MGNSMKCPGDTSYTVCFYASKNTAGQIRVHCRLVDFKMRKPEPLSGKDTGSFAYLTIRDRLPVILTKVIDGVHRRTIALRKESKEALAEDCKEIISKLSKLRHMMQTDKKLTLIEDSDEDAEIWNRAIKAARSLVDGSAISWFSGAWLTCECYMYRKVYEAISLSQHHQMFDPFEEQKQKSFTALLESVESLAQHLGNFVESNTTTEDETLKGHFQTFMQFCLWGNKCDLSISSGEVLMRDGATPASQLDHLEEKILVDHSMQVWQQLQGNRNSRIDFVLDNSGFELFTDLCLAEFFLQTKLASEVHLHVKNIPWFVSDASRKDLLWMLNEMKSSANQHVANLGNKWFERIADGSFLIREHLFWTLAQDYSEMQGCCADLHGDLSKSKLVVFKGDLNYRKLVGDRKWEHTTPFATALAGFCPAPLCSLRTLKADVQVGLAEGQDTSVQAVDADWMTSGNYAVIQYVQCL